MCDYREERKKRKLLAMRRRCQSPFGSGYPTGLSNYSPEPSNFTVSTQGQGDNRMIYFLVYLVDVPLLKPLFFSRQFGDIIFRESHSLITLYCKYTFNDLTIKPGRGMSTSIVCDLGNVRFHSVFKIRVSTFQMREVLFLCFN